MLEIFLSVIQNFIISCPESKSEIMRGIFILAVLFIFVSCNHQQSVPLSPEDSAYMALKRDFPNDTLETLFLIRDEAQLKDFYGKKNVVTGAIKGADDNFYIGTRLFYNTPDEVIISWSDTAKHAKVATVVQSCNYDENSESYMLDTRWRTRSGVHIGTSLNELVTLNGNDFMFYGLGWDFGGDITDWRSGNLANKKLYVKLGVDQMTDDQGKQYLKILGDKEYSSENPAAIKLDPFVVEIILSGK
jgi:hypothetical protein